VQQSSFYDSCRSHCVFSELSVVFGIIEWLQSACIIFTITVFYVHNGSGVHDTHCKSNCFMVFEDERQMNCLIAMDMCWLCGSCTAGMIMTVVSYRPMLYEVSSVSCLDVLCLYICWCSGGPPSVRTIGNLKGSVTLLWTIDDFIKIARNFIGHYLGWNLCDVMVLQHLPYTDRKCFMACNCSFCWWIC